MGRAAGLVSRINGVANNGGIRRPEVYNWMIGRHNVPIFSIELSQTPPSIYIIKRNPFMKANTGFKALKVSPACASRRTNNLESISTSIVLHFKCRCVHNLMSHRGTFRLCPKSGEGVLIKMFIYLLMGPTCASACKWWVIQCLPPTDHYFKPQNVTVITV